MPLKRRSSFSAANAARFKKLFDQALATEKNILVTVRGSQSSFHIKCSDALRWLMIHGDDEHTDTMGNLHKPGDYARLRGMVKFKAMPEGKILLAFQKNEPVYQDLEFIQEAPTKQELIAESREHPDRTDPALWRGKLIQEFVENGDIQKSGETFKMTGLNLSLDEINWAKNILGQIPDCQFVVDEEMVVAKVIRKII